MIRTSVLHQNHLLVPQEDPSQTALQPSFKSGEKECYLSFLKKCRNMGEFKQAHAHILKLGLFLDPFCASNLLSTCALSDWGSMDYARSMFDEMPEPGSFQFNTLIRGHLKDTNMEEALLTYIEMVERGVKPDNFTYPSLLKACARLPALAEGMQAHGHVFKLGFHDDVFVQNSLVSMYGKCGEIGLSCAVFDQMNERNVASWSAIIAAHSSLGMWNDCLRLLGDMNREKNWKAEESILVSVLSACTHLGVLDLGRSVHGFLLRNMTGLNVIVETSLLEMYMKCGNVDKGMHIFQNMAKEKKNKMSYSVMISGLAMHGYGRESLRVFAEMIQQGLEPDDVVYVGVLTACSHAGLVREGLQCFDRMKLEQRIEPTIQHYGCMVDLLGRAGKIDEALELVKAMPMEPNDVVWRSLLSASNAHGDLETGEVAGRRLFELNSLKSSDYVVLSNMYARAGRWTDMARTRTEMHSNGLNQRPGFCSVEVKRKMHRFVSQDAGHPQNKSIYEMMYQMEWQLKFEGYAPEIDEEDEEEKKQRLKGHSQKIAIAFALINTSDGCPIRIVRNLRMCNDCHTYTKLISMIFDREITVRDRNRFHHFKDGVCSCRDYW